MLPENDAVPPGLQQQSLTQEVRRCCCGLHMGCYEQPVVMPQSSQTLQVPFCLTRMEPQFSHCSPV